MSSLVVSTGTPQTLPDPTTSGGIAFTYINSDDADVVFNSTGATPFLRNGAPVATYTMPGGSVRSFKSNGTRWVVDGVGA